MSGQLIETEETLIIETPERVPLEFALASIGKGEILIDLNGEDATQSPTKRSLQIGKGNTWSAGRELSGT